MFWSWYNLDYNLPHGECVCIQTAIVTSTFYRDFTEHEHLPACVVYIPLTVSLHTRTCCMHKAVCTSSCTVRVLWLSILHLAPTPLSSQVVVNATLPPTLLLTGVWMVSSVTEDNEGRILWPTTPMWHIPKSPVVASDNRWRENGKQGSGWCIYTSSMLGSLVNSLMVNRYTACCCSDAWKTIRVFLLGCSVSLPSEHVKLPGIEITNPI